jgi:hypothetical protein
MGWAQNDVFDLVVADGGQQPPPVGAFFVSYATTVNQQQHVIYRDAKGTLHELLFSNSKWSHNDLFQIIPGAKKGAADSRFNGYAIVNSTLEVFRSDRQYINFLDVSNNPNTFRFENGQWIQLNWPAVLVNHDPNSIDFPAQLGLIAGYSDNLAHLCYIGTDARLHEIYFGDDTIGTNIPSAGRLDPVAMYGYATDWNDQEHVILMNRTGTVVEYVHKDSGWSPTNLTQDTETPPSGHNTALHAHLTGWNKQQHVIFVDSGGHVIEVYNQNGSGTWHPRDLVKLASQNSSNVPPAGDPNGTTARDVTSYSTDWNNQQHVDYVDANGNVNELYFDGSAWRHNNLMQQANTTSRAAVTQLASHATSWNNQQHVFYLDSDNHINELVFK